MLEKALSMLTPAPVLRQQNGGGEKNAKHGSRCLFDFGKNNFLFNIYKFLMNFFLFSTKRGGKLKKQKRFKIFFAKILTNEYRFVKIKISNTSPIKPISDVFFIRKTGHAPHRMAILMFFATCYCDFMIS